MTWPFANGFDHRLLWIAVTIALLWYFGGRLEAQAGRTQVRDLVPGRCDHATGHRRHGCSTCPKRVSHRSSSSCLLRVIAEYPNVRFFFGIPAWVLGPSMSRTEILQLTGDRGRAVRLLFFVVSLPSARHGRQIDRDAGGVSRGFREISMAHRRARSTPEPGTASTRDARWSPRARGASGSRPQSTSHDQSKLDSTCSTRSRHRDEFAQPVEKERLLNDLCKRLRKR